MNLGNRIKTLRRKHQLTLRELSKKIDISISFLSDIENGRTNPSLERLTLIAKALNVSISYLLGEDENKSLNVVEVPISYLTHPKENTLTKQDREELKRDAEYIKNAMMSVTGLAFNGKPQDEETLEKVMIALEEAMILARKEAQKKYTPKKYRKKED